MCRFEKDTLFEFCGLLDHKYSNIELRIAMASVKKGSATLVPNDISSKTTASIVPMETSLVPEINTPLVPMIRR